MIVVDASAVTELLLQTALGTRVEQRLYRQDDDLHAPHLLDVEVLSRAATARPFWNSCGGRSDSPDAIFARSTGAMREIADRG